MLCIGVDAVTVCSCGLFSRELRRRKRPLPAAKVALAAIDRQANRGRLTPSDASRYRGIVDRTALLAARLPSNRASPLLSQVIIGAVAAVYLSFAVSAPGTADLWPLFRDWVLSGFTMPLPTRADLIVPFFKTVSYPLGVFGFVALTWLVIVGSSNAVNLTDGLDGLAIMPTVMVGSALGIFAYVVGRVDYSKYLLFPYIPGASELMVLCAAIAGAGLAFLWFNAYPAQVFMGDVGALALGGALGTIAVIVRQEIVLFIMGGVFVVETLSVMLQVVWFKYTRRRYGEGRRMFRMAPLHHHFEVSGWKETQVVVRFWIISMMLVLIGLASLKLR